MKVSHSNLAPVREKFDSSKKKSVTFENSIQLYFTREKQEILKTMPGGQLAFRYFYDWYKPSLQKNLPLNFSK